MKVSEVMQSANIVTAGPDSLAKDIAGKITSSRISGIPIVNEAGELVGIVTAFDIIRALRRGGDVSLMKASEIMTPNVITVEADAELDTAMGLLEHAGIIRVVVVSDGKLVGLVSRGDVLKAILEAEKNQAA